MTTNLTPCAEWTPDCNGKQDYDGRLLSISTRYWPAWKSLDNRPSAVAAIHLNFGEPDEHGYGDYAVWREQEFAADSEADVKALVEAWVDERFNEVVALIGGVSVGR